MKRVLTRSGDSSYWINNVQVRKRDMADLFLGTGLGGDAYAIVEQGMISRIIEAKPEELRGFLEEAAGVSKYKERRKETESRLRDTRENLERVSKALWMQSSNDTFRIPGAFVCASAATLRLAKITDMVNSHRSRWAHCDFMRMAEEAGFTVCDLIVKIRNGPMMSNKWKEARHARKRHCFWIVCRNGERCERRLR